MAKTDLEVESEVERNARDVPTLGAPMRTTLRLGLGLLMMYYSELCVCVMRKENDVVKWFGGGQIDEDDTMNPKYTRVIGLQTVVCLWGGRRES